MVEIIILLSLPVIITMLYIIISFAYSNLYYIKMKSRYPFKKDINGILTIDEAVSYLKGLNLKGWDLIEKAQNLVAAKMEYSRRNSWDSPETAFKRGMGYCLQQAEALKLILNKLNIRTMLVQSSKNIFPSKKIHEYISSEAVYGHVWLEVYSNNEMKYVCPGNIMNKPGVIHFKILNKVTS